MCMEVSGRENGACRPGLRLVTRVRGSDPAPGTRPPSEYVVNHAQVADVGSVKIIHPGIPRYIRRS